MRNTESSIQHFLVGCWALCVEGCAFSSEIAPAMARLHEYQAKAILGLTDLRFGSIHPAAALLNGFFTFTAITCKLFPAQVRRGASETRDHSGLGPRRGRSSDGQRKCILRQAL